MVKVEVTREFIGGTLKGLTYTDIRTVSAKSVPVVGFVCKKPVGGSPYKIISVVNV
jgi:hypothetical protein